MSAIPISIFTFIIVTVPIAIYKAIHVVSGQARHREVIALSDFKSNWNYPSIETDTEYIYSELIWDD
jgi:hypothetical protein